MHIYAHLVIDIQMVVRMSYDVKVFICDLGLFSLLTKREATAKL